jgi:IS5 family transposase
MPTHQPTSSGLTLNDGSVQSRIRLPLPIVVGNCDYRERQELLTRMDEILKASGIEMEYIHHAVRQARDAAAERGEGLSDRQRQTVQSHASKALRCTIARILSNESHRSFSCHLAESPLLQWFCACDGLDAIRVPAKSTLQRMESEVPRETITALHTLLLQRSGEVVAGTRESVLGLAEPVDLSMIWMDSTCAKLDIHYPADWTLLRDATRSIIACITVIRRHGLVHRMPEPASLVAAMNQQCMGMSAASRRGRGGDKKKERKARLRAMKMIANKVRRHGQRYRELLVGNWKDSDLSQAQAQQVIDRLDRLLAALPAAQKQAHERIIGERIVPNEEKILSLYEPHAKVYVRGKTGADAEFGLQLLICESAEGLIVDATLGDGAVANDSTLLIPALQRIRDRHGKAAATTVIADRGFSSAEHAPILADMGIMDATLPRSPAAMEEFLKDSGNRRLHRRRAQTEARIGIFKANFIGDHLPTKGFDNQQRFVAWAMLAHNLWVLARQERMAAPAQTVTRAS